MLTSGLDEFGFPCEVTEDDFLVAETTTGIKSRIFEKPSDPEETRRTNHQDIQALVDAVGAMEPRLSALICRESENRWGKPIFEIAVVHEGEVIGGFIDPVKPNVGKMLLNMAKQGFVFTAITTIRVETVETVGFNPGVSTGVIGTLHMPELSRLKDFDPTQQRLFDLPL